MTGMILRLGGSGLGQSPHPFPPRHGRGERLSRQYTFVGYQARDGSKLAFLESLTGPDGKMVKIWFGDPNAN